MVTDSEDLTANCNGQQYMTIGQYKNEEVLVHVFLHDTGNNWTSVAKANVPEPKSRDFGDQVALSDDKVVVTSSDNIYSYDLKDCLDKYKAHFS